MGYDVLQEVKRKIPKNTWICLITGLVTGWITHFYMLTHKLPNWDDVNNMSSWGAGDNIGRWFLKYLHPLGSQYSIPAVHGALMILCLSVAACLVVAMLRLRSTTAAVLVPMLMVTFPSVACSMTFMFTAHAYGIAIVMVCLAVYLLRAHTWGVAPCILLLTCVLGTYQSYITIAIALMLIGMLTDILEGQEYRNIIKRGVFYALTLIITVVIYIALSHVIWPNLDSETYGGVGSMGRIDLAELPTLIGRCYKRFLEYFIWKPFSFVSDAMQTVNIIVCVLAWVLGIFHIMAGRLYQRPLECLMFIVICGLLPLAVAFIYLMAPDAPFSMLMLYAYVLIYITVVMLWEKGGELLQRHVILSKTAAVIITTVMIASCYCNYLVSNTAYFRMELSYERVSAYFNRIIMRVEAMDGYQNGDDVAILGEFYYVDNPSPVETDGVYTEELREMDGVALENGLITSGVRDNFIETYIGFDMGDVSDTQKDEIMESETYRSMQVYPAKGSIAQIDNVWVVKLCE